MEILENVSKYNPGREPGEEFGLPIALIGLENEKFLLSTGNLVLNSGINDLMSKLDMINESTQSGLKELFLKSLADQTIDTDSTGNMGFIDIARKSGSRLEYGFETVNDLYSYYTLTVKVGKNGD